MKKILSAAFVLSVLVLTAFAQERVIQKDEYDRIQINGRKWLTLKSYRQIITAQNTTENHPSSQSTSKSIAEFAPSAFRSVFEYVSPYGKNKRETIKIKDKFYTRENDGVWKEGKPEESKPLTEFKLSTLETEIEYKFLGNENLNDQNTGVYAKIEKKKLVDEDSKMEMFTVNTTKSWISADGSMLKSENTRETRIGKRVSRNVTSTIWELDPNIKIEAPVIAAAGFTNP